MKFNNKWLVLALVLTLSALFLLPAGDANAAIDGGYVGSAACGVCHTTQYSDFVKSGHPYKVRVTNGATPTSGTDPLSALLSATMPNTADLLNPNSEANVKVTDVNGKLDWSAVSYVIGGFGWKARWGVKDTVDNTATGYIWSSSVASPTGAQFNMLAADTTFDPKGHRANWSTYGSATKKYSCAICHNTNGTSSTDALCSTPLGSGRTEPWASTGLTTTAPGGFRSEWTYSGVQCEACHGPGEAHSTTAVLPSTNPNPIGSLNVTHGANSYEICAKCHIRTNNNALGYGDECGGNSNEAILTGGSTTNATTGFEGHHQQFNQVFGYSGDGAHADLTCIACHDPHKRAHKVTDAIATAMGITDNDLSAEARGAVVSCESCHPGKDLKYNMGDITCVDCHMASSTQSATSEKATGTTNGIAAWGKTGDVAGHIFKIDPTATTISRVNAAGKTIAQNYITVDYACGKCHDPYMNDYSGAALTQAQAMATAQGIHINLSNQAPTVSHTGGADVLKGTATSIVDASTDPENAQTALSIFINWGDGTTSTGIGGATFTHTYANAGTYNVVHSATDTDGKTASEAVFQTKVMLGSTTKTKITVTVTQSNGTTPISGARIYLKKAGVLKTTGYSNTSGVWTFSNLLPAADYTVEVYKSGVNFGNGVGKMSAQVSADTTTGDVPLSVSAVTP